MILLEKNFNTITNNIFCLSHPKNCFNNWKKQIQVIQTY